MLHPFFAEAYATQKRAQLVAEAAQRRLIAEARLRPRRRPFAEWVFRMGTRLVAWGWALQAYAAAPSRPADCSLDAAPLW